MILAIETSTPRASLALLDPAAGATVWKGEFVSERAHNAVIFEPLTEALDRCGRNLSLIVVGTGPGSYSGVRVGIAVANGLSLALAAPAIGISSLPAFDPGDAEFAVAGDARRESFFLARIRGGAMANPEPKLLTQQGMVDDLTLLSRAEIPVFTADPPVAERFGARLAFPSAAILAGRAAALDPLDAARLSGEPLEPIYLRAPHITVPKERPHRQSGRER